MDIKILPAYEYKDELRELFREYTDMLCAGEPRFSDYLVIQDYEEEIRQPDNKYGLPCGRLFIAFCNGKPAGCIGLHQLDTERCEMKRLYVRPEFRSMGIGKKLTELILSEARVIGYKQMLLDTLPFLGTAVSMYKKIGFSEIARYNDSPISSTIFMRLDL